MSDKKKKLLRSAKRLEAAGDHEGARELRKLAKRQGEDEDEEDESGEEGLNEKEMTLLEEKLRLSAGGKSQDD